MCWQVHAVPKAGDTKLCSDLRSNVPTRPHSHAIEVGTGKEDPHASGLTVGVPQRGQGSNHLTLCLFNKCTEEDTPSITGFTALEDGAAHSPAL